MTPPALTKLLAPGGGGRSLWLPKKLFVFANAFSSQLNPYGNDMTELRNGHNTLSYRLGWFQTFLEKCILLELCDYYVNIFLWRNGMGSHFDFASILRMTHRKMIALLVVYVSCSTKALGEGANQSKSSMESLCAWMLFSAPPSGSSRCCLYAPQGFFSSRFETRQPPPFCCRRAHITVGVGRTK